DEDLSVRAVEDAVRQHQAEDEAGAPDDGSAASHGSPGRPRPRPPRPRAAASASPGRRRLRPPGLLELEELLGDHLETRVKISMGSARGKVVVEFSTLEDLERIYRRITDGNA